MIKPLHYNNPVLKNSLLLISFLLILSNLHAQTKSAKRGLGYGYHSIADMNAIKSGISWWYNWAPQPDAGVAGTYPNSEVAFMPMVWGGNFNVEDVISKIPAGAKYLLAFNEPNFRDQANLTPQQMASLWPKIEEIASRRNLKIVSPAVNYCGNCTLAGVTDPVVYLDQFFAACPSCKVDYVAIHWYACSRSALEWYIGLFKKYNRPIWVTEIACWEGNPTLAQQKAYMTEAVDVMEKDPMVYKYAWFTGRSSGPNIDVFSSASGQLSELGKLYVSLPFSGGVIPSQPVPGRIQAESFTAQTGIQTQPTTDLGGGLNVGWVDAGDWMDYNVNVATAGTYTISFRVASTAATGQLQLRKGTTVLGTVAVPNTGGWQTWTTVTANVALTAGVQTLRVHASAAPFNFNWMDFTRSTTSSTNLALRKPVTVSSTENAGTPGASAVDGNAATRWSSAFSDPQWIAVDLGSTYNINRVKITWESAYGRNYTIQTSSNGSTWTTLKTITSNSTLVNDHTGLSSNARYVRIYGTARATGYGYSIFEFEVYGNAAARLEDQVANSNELFSTYPNPVANSLNFSLSSEGSKVVVRDRIGKKMFETKVLNAQIDLSTLPSGVYILEVKIGDRIATKRIVKN